MSRKMVVAVYGHPEAYPPTLNALTGLSAMFDHISVIYRPLLSLEWDYEENIDLYPSGEAMNARQQETLPLLKRIGLFLRFTIQFYRLCRRERPDVILMYDPLPVLAYRIMRIAGLPRHISWYYNHDVLEPVQKRFSLNWWAIRAEKQVFPHLDIFSLPAEERKAYFPIDLFRGTYFFLPNQPSVSFYSRYHGVKKTDASWRLIFQGHIDKGHGIEEIMDLMPGTINGRPLKLVLKGWIRDEYKAELEKRIRERGIGNDVSFVGYTAYQELPKLTASCHIGIAIHTKTDIMNKTLGTASNKIYEYAAAGLPVLYYDNEHFVKHLGRYEWAVPTDVSRESLTEAIRKITAHYERLSDAAREDFMEQLNYEYHFRQAGKYLESRMAPKADKLKVTA